jgi:hypothetical protein
MTTSIFRIDLAHQFTLATPREGASACAEILNALACHPTVILELCNHSVTPSFTDECFGAVAARLGFEDFRRRVHLVGVADSTRMLLQHVISRRASVPA